MKRFAYRVFILAVLLGNTTPTQGWSLPGHMVIAELAYHELSAADKQTVDELLAHHPDYATWNEAHGKLATNLDLGTFIFMRASTWADEIRHSGSPFDHPRWHFIDYPVKPPGFLQEVDAAPNDDVLFGIARCQQELRDSGADGPRRAVHLALLIHLIGDIHQPLHCATLVTPEYPPPLGDKGGNLFPVRPATKGIKLHMMWDQALGSSVDFRRQFDYAIQLRSEQPRAELTELALAIDPAAWSLESRRVAIDAVYLDGTLQGSKTEANATRLPENYTKNLKRVAERRAALAAYRLADELHKLLN